MFHGYVIFDSKPIIANDLPKEKSLSEAFINDL